MSNRPNIDRIVKVLSEILSDKYNANITIEAIPKSQLKDSQEQDKGAIA